MRICSLTLVMLLVLMGVSSTHAQSQPELVPIRALAGDCRAWSASGTHIATTQGVYALETGARLFALDNAARAVFAPDGTALAIAGDGVYTLPTGERQITFANAQARYAVFDAASTLVAVDNDGVYDLATGTRQFKIAQGNPVFLTIGDVPYIAVDFFIYDLAGTEHSLVGTTPFNIAWQRFHIGSAVYSLSPGGVTLSVPALLSPDEQTIAVRFDGIYATDTGAKLAALPTIADTQAFYALRYSADGKYLLVGDTTVYDVATGDIADVAAETIFPPETGAFSGLDAQLRVQPDDGVYAADERLFAIAPASVVPSVLFSVDDALAAVTHPAIAPGNCVIWARATHPLVATTGTLNARYETDVRLAADEDSKRLAYTLYGGAYRVLARNADSSAYLVAGVGLVRGNATVESIVSGWVSERFTKDILVPPELPVISA